MPKLSAEWKKKQVELRELGPDDFDALVALQLRCFPKMKTWTREQFDSQIQLFPEGQIGIFAAGRLVASSASLIVDDADYSDWANWVEMSDHGHIKNHDPEGDSLYGIEIQVDPEMRGKKLARRLYDARKELCRRKDLARIIIGGRIPGYAAHADKMTAREYVESVMQKSLFDPVLTVQLANGFQMRELVKDYLPTDEDSAGWATCLEWPNLEHAALRSHRSRRSIAPVRVSAVQYQMRRIASLEDFAKQVEFFVDVASDAKSDFVLFPELFTLQLLSIVKPSRPGTAARTLAEMTPRYLELFRDLAVRYNVNVIGGSQFVLEEQERLYNASYLFRRDGSVDRQLKIHVTPNESKWWGVRGGDHLNVFDTDHGKIAIQICYDVEFPELARVAAHRGAQILFVPFNTNDRVGYLRVLALRAGAVHRESDLHGDVRLRRQLAVGGERRHALRRVRHLHALRRRVRTRRDRRRGLAEHRDGHHARPRHRAAAARAPRRHRPQLGGPAHRPLPRAVA